MRPGSSRSRRPGRSAVRRDDDTDLDYHDTLAGNFWRPNAESRAGDPQRRRGSRAPPPAITHNNAP